MRRWRSERLDWVDRGLSAFPADHPPKRTSGFRPDYVTPDRHGARKRPFRFAPIAAILPNSAASRKRTLANRVAKRSAVPRHGRILTKCQANSPEALLTEADTDLGD
jgi:hypothetical protein